jgi:hypothetical protein
MISAYEHGQNAAWLGKHIQACPFDTGTEEWQEWRDGFRSASSRRQHQSENGDDTMKYLGARVGASTLAACGYAPIQWKIALGWMRETNAAAHPVSRRMAEYHLDRYFEVVEAQLSQLRH